MRDIDIRNYVPPFLLEYGEFNELYKAENPEFKILDAALDRMADNQFVDSADEAGVSRYEGILKLKNASQYTLEERKLRINAKITDDIPYTWNVLKERLDRLCGAGKYRLELKEKIRTLVIGTHLSYQAQSEELEKIIKIMRPANMAYVITNSFENILQADVGYAGGGIVSTDYIELSD